MTDLTRLDKSYNSRKNELIERFELFEMIKEIFKFQLEPYIF